MFRLIFNLVTVFIFTFIFSMGFSYLLLELGHDSTLLFIISGFSIGFLVPSILFKWISK